MIRQPGSVMSLVVLSCLPCGAALAQEWDRSVILGESGTASVSAAAARKPPRTARLLPPGEDPTPTPTPRPRPKRYWADPQSNCILRANLDGSAREALLCGASAPYGLTYDEAAMRLVWTNSGDETVQSMVVGGAPSALISSFEDDYAIEAPARDGRRVSYALIGADIVRVTQDPQSEAESREVLLTLDAPLSVHGLALSPDGSALYLGDAAGRMSQSLPVASPQLRSLIFINEVPPPDTRPNPYPVGGVQ